MRRHLLWADEHGVVGEADAARDSLADARAIQSELASSAVGSRGVAGLPTPIEGVAVPGRRIPSRSPYAPVVGFSAAACAGDFIFVAGVTAVDPSGEVIGEGDPYAQAREALHKVGLILADAGARLEDVIQTRVYITAAEHWEAAGQAHGEVFGAALPASAMLVTQLVDARMLVEIEAVAYVGRDR